MKIICIIYEFYCISNMRNMYIHIQYEYLTFAFFFLNMIFTEPLTRVSRMYYWKICIYMFTTVLNMKVPNSLNKFTIRNQVSVACHPQSKHFCFLFFMLSLSSSFVLVNPMDMNPIKGLPNCKAQLFYVLDIVSWTLNLDDYRKGIRTY